MINQNYQIMFYHITHINNKNITISASTGFQELFGLMMTFTRLEILRSHNKERGPPPSKTKLSSPYTSTQSQQEKI